MILQGRSDFHYVVDKILDFLKNDALPEINIFGSNRILVHLIRYKLKTD